MFGIHVILIILKAVLDLAANLTGLHTMYFTVVKIKISFVAKHFITWFTLMITPISYADCKLKLVDNLFLQKEHSNFSCS